VQERLVHFRPRAVLVVLGIVLAAAVTIEVVLLARSVIVWILIAVFLALALNPAVEWLQRIYVVEARPALSVTRIRELRQGLIDSGAGAPRLVAVDNLDKLANESDLLHSVAELKELAETFGIVVVGAATELSIVHERSADMAATFHQENGKALVSISAGPAAQPTVLRFDHRRGTHRFDECNPPGA